MPTLLADAIAFHHKGELTKAAELYQEILNAEPENADAWHLMGVAAHQQGNNELAAKLIQNAISLNNDVADFYSNLGLVQSALENDEVAETNFRQAIEINSGHTKALGNLAGLLRRRGQFSVAVDYARRAVQAGADNFEAHNNLGNALKDLGGEWLEDAVASYRRAIELAPDYALARWNLSLALLSLGQFEEGFAEMRWRWQWPGFPARAREFDQPLWQRGEDITGKRILLHAEQGLGDCMHFIRYGAVVRRLGATVIFECPGALIPLVNRTELIDELVPAGDPLPVFDLHAALLDLPDIVGTEKTTIPADTPYLTVPAEIAEKWGAQVNQQQGLRVGINWSGNPRSPVERFRTLPSDELLRLAAVTGVSWYSLQKGDHPEDVPPLAEDFPLIETGPAALAETAGLIQALDLVITSDTAVAHLAGALGKPVWVLLHHAPDWRWGVNQANSLWYPSMRLFRQARPGDWTAVIDQVKNALIEERG